MSGFGLLKNMVFEWNGTVFRIERLQADGDVLIERMNDGKLSIISRDTLLAEYGNGKISAAKSEPSGAPVSPPIFSRPLDELSSQVHADYVRRRHYLESVLAHGKPVFTPAYLEPLIQRAAECIGDKKPPSACPRASKNTQRCALNFTQGL